MLVVTALDDVAWLLNIRGSDVEYNPVCFSYATVTATSVTLYIDPFKVTVALTDHLGSSVTLRPYDAIAEDLTDFAAGGAGKVWLDGGSCSWAIRKALPASDSAVFTAKPGPIALMKALKNPVEIEGFRQAHLRDGVAIVQLFGWMERYLNQREGDPALPPLTEHLAALKSEEFRAAQPGFVSLSFPTIAGSGPNGAIIHYKPPAEGSAEVTKTQMFLCDSGAQYLDGTTDITRTLHFGEPTPWERQCFTRVLQGHIALATAVFPKGTTGHSLDTLARTGLWRGGLDYRHGTGHGVGSFLNVHEGPEGIASRPRAYVGGMQPSMTMTDEPGYYEDGAFGIRIESVLVAKRADFDRTFGNVEFLDFEVLTCAPIQTKLVDPTLLAPSELAFLNHYNGWCRQKLAPLLTGEDLAYLLKETQPIVL